MQYELFGVERNTLQNTFIRHFLAVELIWRKVVHRYMSNVSKNIDGGSIEFQVSKRIRIKKRKKFAKRIEFSEF